jgi:CcmD family protein
MDNFSYLFAAFTVIWVALFVYVFILSQRQNSLKREIDKLKTLIKPEAK